MGTQANRRGSYYRGGYTTPSMNLRLQPKWAVVQRALRAPVRGTGWLRDSRAISIRSPSFRFGQQVRSDYDVKERKSGCWKSSRLGLTPAHESAVSRASD